MHHNKLKVQPELFRWALLQKQPSILQFLCQLGFVASRGAPAKPLAPQSDQ
jgi:hypothetical protein